MTGFGDRPDWVEEGAELAGEAVDMVSGRRYRLWRLPLLEKQRRLLKRAKTQPSFLVEEVDLGKPVALLHSWEDSVAWHDRTVISCGWTTGVPNVPTPHDTDDEVAGIAEIRHLPLTREQHAGRGGS